MATNVLTTKAQSLVKVVGKKQSAIELEARSNFAVFYQLIAATIAELSAIPSDKILAKHHWRIIDELCTNKSNQTLKDVAGDNSVVLMPRGSAKSFITKFWVTWVIGNNPSIPILFVSTTSEVAEGFSLDIQSIIEHNEVYHNVFPEIIPGKPWNVTKWQIDVKTATGKDAATNYTLIPYGLNSSISSKRSALIICDDIVTKRIQVDSSDKREARRNNWYNSILPTLIDGGRIVVLGTIYHELDEFTTIFTEKNNYRVLKEKAIQIDEHGKEYSFWEDMFPYKTKLCRLRSEAYPEFMMQYQLESYVKTSDSFNHEWIKYGPMLPIEDYFTLAIGIDLASTIGAKSDYTVMMLCGTTPDGDYHVIDYMRGKWMGNNEKIEKLLWLCEEYGIIERNSEAPEDMGLRFGLYNVSDALAYIIPERVAYQESFRGDFEKIVSDELELFNLISHTMKAPRSSKGLRFLGITGAFEHGKVFLNEDRAWHELTGELIGFGSSEHDDMVDALVYALKFLFKRKPMGITTF